MEIFLAHHNLYWKQNKKKHTRKAKKITKWSRNIHLTKVVLLIQRKLRLERKKYDLFLAVVYHCVKKCAYMGQYNSFSIGYIKEIFSSVIPTIGWMFVHNFFFFENSLIRENCTPFLVLEAFIIYSILTENYYLLYYFLLAFTALCK